MAWVLVLRVVSGTASGETKSRRLLCLKVDRRETRKEEPGEEGERAVMGNQGKGQDGEGEPSGL
jgi:hypothetical protein